MMIYALGSNSCGQLGVCHTDDVAKPQLVQGVDGGIPIKQIAAGGNHTLILLDNGEVLACGDDDNGQCSKIVSPGQQLQQATSITLRPFSTTLASPVKIAQVSASWTASIYLTTTGEIVTTGEGDNGEISINKKHHTSLLPDFPPQAHITHIASCMAHTVAVLSNGEVWGWGKGSKGQLGHPPASSFFTPTCVSASVPFHAVKAVCGKDFTCIIGSREKGEIAVLGLDRNDRFGVREQAPKAVAGWKDIAASWGSVYVLKDDGEVVAWGRNDHGQLPPRGLPLVKAMAAGSEHCLALTRAGKVLAWGWGEHGNCGEITDKGSDVKDRWNEIRVEGEVEALFAGCATSFIVAQAEQAGGY